MDAATTTWPGSRDSTASFCLAVNPIHCRNVGKLLNMPSFSAIAGDRRRERRPLHGRLAFAEAQREHKKRKTRRELFLERMEL
jgi:hypothetical protein